MSSTALLETSDLNLATFLRCRGFAFLEIRRNGGRTLFVFAEGAELRQAVIDFANDGAVGARTYANTLRDLKALTRG